MKKLYLLLIAFLLMNGLKAQYVTIPDTNFVNWLQVRIPSAMNGNQLDTTSAAISNIVTAKFFGWSLDLTGLKYLTSLKTLECTAINGLYIPAFPSSLKVLNCSNNMSANVNSSLPSLDTLIWTNNWGFGFTVLPPSLKYLDCESNNVISLPTLPSTLEYLRCTLNQINSLPALPTALKYLYCDRNNNMTSLPTLPLSLLELDCSSLDLPFLPTLPGSLQYLNCNYNQISNLPVLPGTLQYLDCRGNQISSLPVLPSALQHLDCSNNLLSSLPSLSSSLRYFDCSYNILTSIPALPTQLYYLNCSNNNLATLPAISGSLRVLNCSQNHLTSLPNLPSLIYDLDCFNNNLTSLPNFPDSLLTVDCSNNQLTSLPLFPDSLHSLACSNNNLTSLAALPSALYFLFCSNNHLTSLPALHSFWMFNCENNQITCFPTLYNYYTPNFGYFTYEWQQGFMNWREFGIKGNPITCLPNYTNTMNDTLLAYPLCMTGDPLNNPHSCNGISGISGTVFKDTIANCSLNAGEPKISNVHLMLYNNGSNLVAQTYTLLNGMYTFSAGPGTYTVKIDTVGVPFDVQCANPGIDSTVTLTPLNPTAYNINFPLVCSNGFDVGVQSITHNGPVFPGQSFSLYVCAGDMSQWSHLNCSSGVGGQVQITVNGPVTYQGVANGALTPAVAGNVFTYTIADFGAISNCTDFGLIFTTDTTATVGNEVCFSITVTPLGGDVNPTNNTFVECFNVSNSMDPNFKEVYPRNVPPGYNGYFTFTVHFQNTGNAPAYNIRIIDYLDSDLDLATFDVINYSHANTVSLIGNALTIRFPNIMLPDSTTNADASMGFVQYRIKPKPNLLAGAQITNTANIYFDYNAPVATNTTTNVFEVMTGVEESPSANSISIFPNPASNKILISGIAKDAFAEIFDISGKLLLTQQLIKPQIDISSLTQGLYFIKLTTTQGSVVKKFVKE